MAQTQGEAWEKDGKVLTRMADTIQTADFCDDSSRTAPDSAGQYTEVRPQTTTIWGR